MKMLLTLTLSGSVLALFLLALRYGILRRMPSTVYYYAWLLVLLRFALPLPGLIPASAETKAPQAETLAESYTPNNGVSVHDPRFPVVIPGETSQIPAENREPVSPVQETESMEPSATATSAPIRKPLDWQSPELWLSLWAFGALLSFGLTVSTYLRFTSRLWYGLHRPSPFVRKLYTSIPGRKCALFCSKAVPTPMMYGLFSPKIVLPERTYEEEQLRNILRHELTHYRRVDTLYKWAAVIILSAHWFNPLGWLIRRELNRSCELSCDELLLRSMPMEEKRSYGNTLLTMAASALPAGVVATTFSTQKRNLKERLEQIMHYKKSKSRLLAAVLALALLAGCGLAAGPQTVPVPQTVGSEEHPPLPEGTVRVTTVDEFLSAIGPNATIYLEAGEYDLSKASDYGKDSASEWYSWEKVWDEGSNMAAELVIRGVEGLRIIGAGMERTTVAAVPRYANVFRFVNCSNLTVSSLTAGHTVEPGFCSGGVLRIEGCTNIIVETCGLYGCGTVGVDATDTNNLTVTGCHIYECSYNAVSLSQCRNVSVDGCDIYRHGTRTENVPSMALFSASYTDHVVIHGNRIYDNNSQFMLQLHYTQNASFLSNEVHNNRFDAGVFQFEQYGATVDGCAFTDNEMQIWVQSNGVYANDAAGKLLSPEDFASMTFNRDIHSQSAVTPQPAARATEVRPGGEIVVSTVDEFLSAIGPNRTIVLDGELFDLSEAGNYGAVGGEYYYWRQSHDGPELVIDNVSGLAIRPAANDAAATTLAAVPRYANVLSFCNCDDLMLVGFTAGHTKEPGSCSGGVLHFQNCSSVRLEDMRLYGCGILGIQAYCCTTIDVQRTEIYECSQGAAQFYQCDVLRLSDCDIHDVPAPAFIFRECGDILWNEEPVSGLHEQFNVSADGSLSSYALPEDSVTPDKGAYSSFAFAEDSQEMAFVKDVQKSIADGDWETLADEIQYPLQIIGEDYFVRVLDREQFLETADSLFTADFRESIASAPLDEFGGTIYGITFCRHRIAFSNYAINAGETMYRVAMISLAQPLWPMYAYAFLGTAAPLS